MLVLLQRRRREDFVHPTSRILRVYLWAVLHDRPTYWACDRRNWAGARPPAVMPDQSTMSRRLRHPATLAMMMNLLDELEPDACDTLVKCVDGKPLTVSRHSRDKTATFGRGAGGLDRGYKLHAVYGDTNKPAAFAIFPMNVDERDVALELIPKVAPGYLLADGNYHATRLFDASAQAGQVLIAPRRMANGGKQPKGVGRGPQSPHRLAMIDRLASPTNPYARDLLATRRAVETRLAHLCNFGGGLTCLPPWVRGRRVRPWVIAKIAVRLTRDRRRREMRA